MNVLVLGGAGELGANFAKLCADLGHSVHILDVTRYYEATRLKELGILDKIKYTWKSSFDINVQDLAFVDLVLDCACQADRPLGTSAAIYTVMENLLGPIHVLETVRKMDKPPFIIYPSSCVEFLGVPKEEQPITELTIPRPTNVYGYTKWAAEELYMTYHRSFKVPLMVVRTGSCYGPMMRTDQFIAQCIIKCLQKQHITVKSPEATRTYTFTEDVLEFYRLFLNKFDKDPAPFDGLIIYNGGNKECHPYSTIEAARLIRDLVMEKKKALSASSITPGDYEVGELVDGKPVYQCEKSIRGDVLGWTAKHTFAEGLEKTIEWFAGKYG